MFTNFIDGAIQPQQGGGGGGGTVLPNFYIVGYEDFSSITTTTVTLTSNSNGLLAPFLNNRIKNNSAIIVRRSNNGFLYEDTNQDVRVTVLSNSRETVTLSHIPNPIWGDIRIYYLILNDNFPENYEPLPTTIATPELTGLTRVKNVDTTDASNISAGVLGDDKLSTNVTLKGNTFNTANNLVELDANGHFPALNGSNLTDINASSFTTGTINDSILSTNVTVKGNTFNTANNLVELDSNGHFTALNASNLTDINANAVTTGTLNDDRLSTNVTVKGNTFNTPNNLVELDSNGHFTALNASNLTDINANAVTTGTLNDDRLSTNVTVKGNTFNTPNNLVELDSNGHLPALNGSNLTDVNGLVPVGTVIGRASSNVPAGYLLCNGAYIYTTTYTALFAEIGYTYGGSGVYFKLPDFLTNERFPRFGSNVGRVQNDELKSHSHTYSMTWTYFGGGANNAKQGDQYQGVFTQNRSTYSTGGSETRPHNITLFPLIKF